MKLLIIRGLPGSGKSTLARTLKGFQHFEADMYYCLSSVSELETDSDSGSDEYDFDPGFISDAHAWCIRKCEEAMVRSQNVVISNTFTAFWEIEPYFELAQRLGAEFEIMDAVGNFGNIHGVPEGALRRMKNRWESSCWF